MKHHHARRLIAVAAIAAAALPAVACRGKRPSTDAAELTAAMKAYLARRGDLCIARATWPVEVTLDDLAAGTRDAVQMPVLERLGLVASAKATDASQLVRYQLTERGRIHYIDRETRRPVAPDAPHAHEADFCVARLTLDQVVAAEVERDGGGSAPARAHVSYTYAVTAAPWMADPAARRAFPAVARVVAGAHTAQLTEELTLMPSGWTANELLPTTPAPTAPTAAPVAVTTPGGPR